MVRRMQAQLLKLSGIVVLCGTVACQDEQGAWDDAVEAGSRDAYETFVARYPSGEHFEEASRRLDSIVADETARASEIIERASSLYRDGEHEESVSLITEATSAYPKLDTPWLALGRLHTAAGELDQALNAFDNAIAVNATNVTSRILRATTLHELDRFTESDKEYQDALRIEPENSLIVGFMLQAHMRKGQYSKAAEVYVTYVELSGQASAANVYGLMARGLLRQFNNTNLPQSDWQPPQDYLPDLTLSQIASPWLQQLSVANENNPEFILGGSLSSGQITDNKRWRFEGSEDSPFEYAPGMSIWSATVIRVPTYGVLIMDGARIKHVEVVDGKEVVRVGEVKDWQFTFP